MIRILPIILLLSACVAPEPAAPPAPALRVDVWHDTICPWCRIGLHNLDVAIAQSGARVEVAYHPFLLNPDAPPDGEDLREHLAAKFGPERVESMFARLSRVGADAGLRFDWAAIRRSPNTVASHAVIDWAPAERRARFVHELHTAYFEHGRDFGNTVEIGQIAQSAGLDARGAIAAAMDPNRLASVRERAAEASRSGITGVPRFVIGGRVLEGAQPVAALMAAIANAEPTGR